MESETNRYKKNIEYRNIINNLNNKYFQNLKLGNILSGYIWGCNQESWVKLILKAISRIFFIGVNFKTKGNGTDLIFKVEYFRADYNTIWNNFKSTLNEDYTEVIVFQSYKKDLKLDVNFLKNMIIFIQSFIEFKQIDNVKVRFKLAYEVVQLLKIRFELDCMKMKYKKIITFCDAQPFDNLVAQLGKLKNITTITLQHGQYVYKKNSSGAIQIAINNFVSDYMLVWGEFTKNQLKKAGIDDNRIKVLGNLRYIYDDFSFDKIIKIENEKNIFGILLDGPIFVYYKETNKQLIETANEFAKLHNMKYIIKIHPADKSEYYQRYIDEKYCLQFVDKQMSIKEYTRLIDFSLLHTSSVYIELLLLLSKAFRMKTKYEYDLEIDKSEEFLDCAELCDKYKTWIDVDNKVKLLDMDKHRKYYVEYNNSEKKYRDFFMALK